MTIESARFALERFEVWRKAHYETLGDENKFLADQLYQSLQQRHNKFVVKAAREANADIV